MIYQFCVIVLVGTFASMTSALPPCACARNLKPVCGSDGQTYNNECLLNCERTKNPDLVLNKVGSCDAKSSGCACTLEYSPICGSDGVTYPNLCSFECDAGEAKQAYSGECRAKREAPIAVSLQECRCSKEADAVCGTDGNTYLNPCLLECAKKVKPDLDLAVRGPCAAGEREFDAGKPNCACTRNLRPVCASDGNTYNNECLMLCAGADLTVTKDEPCYDE